jgi:hypothetical protein
MSDNNIPDRSPGKEMPGASCELDAGLKETGTMISLTSSADTRNNCSLVRFIRPRMERELDGDGWLCILGDHDWLHGPRQQALREFRRLSHIERRGRP